MPSAKLVSRQQRAELEQGGLVQNAVNAQLDLGKKANRFAIMQHLCRYRVAQRVPVLKEGDRQHRLHWLRWTVTRRPSLWRIMRFDKREWATPWALLPQSRQEQLEPRPLLLLHCGVNFEKARLFPRRQGSLKLRPHLPYQAVTGSFSDGLSIKTLANTYRYSR